MPTTTRPWTAADDELVRKLPPRQAARRLRRTLRAVYSRRHKLGLTDERRRWTPVEDALLAKLLTEQAMRYLRRSPASVHLRRVRLGLLRRP